MNTIFCFIYLISVIMFEFRLVNRLVFFMCWNPNRVLLLFSLQFSFLFLIIHILSLTPIKFFLINAIFPALIFTFYVYEIKKARAKFDIMIEKFLSRVVLSIKAGLSFRRSYMDSLRIVDERNRSLLQELYQRVTFSQHEIPKQSLLSSFSRNEQQNLLMIFQKAHDDQSHSLLILENYRDLLAMKRDFRRRSGQITMQLRIQTLIVAIAYIGVLFYLIASGKVSQHATIIMFSVITFIIGCMLIYFVGRKSKWKL